MLENHWPFIILVALQILVLWGFVIIKLVIPLWSAWINKAHRCKLVYKRNKEVDGKLETYMTMQ